MADTKNAAYGDYRPEMDGNAHEATYQGFVRFAEIGTAVLICWVIALAVGGVKHAWLTSVLGILLSLVAGGVGAMSSAIGVRAPAAVAVLLLLALAFY